MRKGRAICAVLLLAATAAVWADSPTLTLTPDETCYSGSVASFQGLGDLPGGTFESYAYGVSADGRVVVGSSRSASGLEAFRWSNGILVGLGDLAGGSFNSEAFRVSSDGSVVVGGGVSSAGPEAFRWVGGTMQGLGFLPPINYPNSSARGVSADGLVVGGVARYGPGDSGTEAFRWQNGVMTGYLLPGYTQSVGTDLSADGTVLVGYGYIVGSNPEQAFRCVNGVMQGLGDLPGGTLQSAARGVSPDGSVIVGYGTSAVAGHEAFRWQDGVMVGLGHLAGGTFSSAADASNRGLVLVGSETVGSAQKAFIWDRFNGMRALKDVLVNDYGLNLTGWSLTDAMAISDDGSVIVGYGTNPTGNTEAWMARIPSRTVTVSIDFTQLTPNDEVLGGQFFLSYDKDKLDFISADPAATIFTNQVYESVNETLATIDYAVGLTPPNTTGYSGAGPFTMATLTFHAIGETCSTADLVTFRADLGSRVTRLTRKIGGHGVPLEVPVGNRLDLSAITMDWTAPTIGAAGANATIDCPAVPSFTAPTATDTCDPAPQIVEVSDVTTPGACTGAYVRTKTWKAVDACGNESGTVSQAITVQDVTPPVIDTCPDDMTVNADAGGCTASVDFGAATAHDACGALSSINYWIGTTQITSPYTFGTGTTTVTVKATDACNNVNDTCTFDVTVRAYTDFTATIELQGPITPVTGSQRCITFTFRDCPSGPANVVSRLVTFPQATAGNSTAVVSFTGLEGVPCSATPYDCVIAEDTLHTLRIQSTPVFMGTQWVANFTGADKLIQGDLYDDNLVDIVDFGVFISEWAADYHSADTNCSTPWPHADMDASGFVDAQDFGFISSNFLAVGDLDCCETPFRSNEPRQSLTVQEAQSLGLPIWLDLNHDGVFDVVDVQLFMSGVRPPRPFEATHSQVNSKAAKAATSE